MLTCLRIKNFKRFECVEIELGPHVVFIGPNNAGKTSALQALALWDIALRRWHEKRGDKEPPRRKAGIAINRKDLRAVPVPEANLLWKDLHVRDVSRASGRPQTKNVRVAIGVDGITDGVSWSCGMELDYTNSESVYCRPHPEWNAGETTSVPDAALQTRIAYLPPMSGLTANELRLDPGAIQVRLGEGRTAEVMRNLCFALFEQPEGIGTGNGVSTSPSWSRLVDLTRVLFGVELLAPEYIAERGEIAMAFREGRNILDISASGRGLQQMVLLLAYMLGNPGSVLLLDEPDAHLEILRQRQMYDVVTTVARETNSQIVAASHSEVLLNEAADKDIVVAFVGKPHRIDDRGSQVAKALKSIGFEHYYQAEQVGWVLYIEGATDLAILKAFARTLKHPAIHVLERTYAHYVGNHRAEAEKHFYGLLEAKRDLVGIVILDHDASDPSARTQQPLRVHRWHRREIENYLCFPEALAGYASAFAKHRSSGPLFDRSEVERLQGVMEDAIREYAPPAALRDRTDPWWTTVKATDDFLDRVFSSFFDSLKLPQLMRKSDYHELAPMVPEELVADEVRLVLDAVVEVAQHARPAQASDE